jgi:hypothetical protein
VAGRDAQGVRTRRLSPAGDPEAFPEGEPASEEVLDAQPEDDG